MFMYAKTPYARELDLALHQSGFLSQYGVSVVERYTALSMLLLDVPDFEAVEALYDDFGESFVLWTGFDINGEDVVVHV